MEWQRNDVWGGGSCFRALFEYRREYHPYPDSWIATQHHKRTCCPVPSTGGLERQRDDSLEPDGTVQIYYGAAGRYNPSTDSLTATRATNAPSARSTHAAVWTGSEMIVWGGYDGFTFFDSGGRYNPLADNWTAPSTIDAPSARYYHTAVWTGSEMIVWGGEDV